MKQVLFDILPRLKCVGFLDTNAWNPSISTAGITHALQFGNALPKNILGCKQSNMSLGFKVGEDEHAAYIAGFVGNCAGEMFGFLEEEKDGKEE